MRQASPGLRSRLGLLEPVHWPCQVPLFRKGVRAQSFPRRHLRALSVSICPRGVQPVALRLHVAQDGCE